MNNTYELKYKSGPHGDACTTYDIVFKKDIITLREFIEDVVKSNPKEWGTFYINYLDPQLANIKYAAEHEKYSECHIVYKYGTIQYQLETELEKVIWDKVIEPNAKNTFANGGWSCMNYWITVK